jgi:hypothetical protein
MRTMLLLGTSELKTQVHRRQRLDEERGFPK